MSDRVFFDTNVLLDHLLAGDQFADDATDLWSMAERRELVGCISAISFDFVYYIVRHQANERAARLAISGLRDVFDIIEVDAQIIHQAIDASFADFEDAIQNACAVRAGAACHLTRDLIGFRQAEITVIAPDQFLRARRGK